MPLLSRRLMPQGLVNVSELAMPRIPQSQSAGALPGVGKATSGLQQNGGFVVGDSSRMTWGTIDITSDGPTAAMVKGWPRWAIPGQAPRKPLLLTNHNKSHPLSTSMSFVTCQSALIALKHSDCPWFFYVILERYLFNRCVFVFQSGFLALVAFQTFLDFAAVCLVASVTLVFWASWLLCFCILLLLASWLFAFCGFLAVCCNYCADKELDRN